MADGDDRPLDDPTAAISGLQARLDDLQSTLLARIAAWSHSTGDIEPTARTTAKPGTLLMQGQTLSRADYPALWAWAQAQGLVGTLPGAWFGPGDGSTTFQLCDMRNRVLVGAGGTFAHATEGGAATVTLATTNLPSHTHPISDSGTHGHSGGSTSSAGSHGGHFPASGFVLAPSGSDSGLAAWNNGGSSGGAHTHTVTVGNGGDHDHGGATGATGSATPISTAQPYKAGNWLIWT